MLRMLMMKNPLQGSACGTNMEGRGPVGLAVGRARTLRCCLGINVTHIHSWYCVTLKAGRIDVHTYLGALRVCLCLWGWGSGGVRRVVVLCRCVTG